MALLDGLGVEVVVADAPDGMVDACFAYDPVFVTGAGAIELRMVKPARQDEPAFLAAEVEKAGVPVHRTAHRRGDRRRRRHVLAGRDDPGGRARLPHQRGPRTTSSPRSSAARA